MIITVILLGIIAFSGVKFFTGNDNISIGSFITDDQYKMIFFVSLALFVLRFIAC